MKFLRLIWRNATRNLRRAMLTILSIAVAIATIAILETIIDAFNAAVKMADESRLVTRNATSLIFPLPLAYRERIRSIPGVKSIAVANWFGGIYQDRKNFFAKFAIDENYFPLYPELVVPPSQLQDYSEDLKGCLVGKKLAEQYGFKVGQTIPIIGDIFPGTWEFNVRGIYEGSRPGVDETTFFFHWKYLDEKQLPHRQGRVGFYMVGLENPSQAGAVAKTIDAAFENSSEQTLTETEKAFQLGFVKMMGNIEFLVRAIGSAVAFALVLVAGNTMAMAARERTTEIAILKTLGFQKGLLTFLIVAEGILLTVLGWAVGCGIAWLLARGVATNFANFFPVFKLEPATVVIALAVAALTGLVSAAFPAILAARTTIAGAMRKVV